MGMWHMVGKDGMVCMASGVPRSALKTPNERLTSTAARTQNRIRSPRLAASGLWNEVGKGSRQLRSVTSGKGLALVTEWRRPNLKNLIMNCLPGPLGAWSTLLFLV